MVGAKKRVALLINQNMLKSVFDAKDIEVLRSFAETNDLEQLPEKVDEEFMKEAIKGADVCITCWGTLPFTEVILQESPNLRLIAHAAGTVKELIRKVNIYQKGIKITCAAPVIADDVAETVVGLMIFASKRMLTLANAANQGKWGNVKSQYFSQMKRLYGCKIGIIGASNVGKNVIKYLKPFETQILLYDPYITKEQAIDLGAVKVELDELMSQADIVTLHAPKTEETYKMINKDQLALMRDNAIFINTSRGSLVNEEALIDELKTGRIFACIDVTDPEPPAAGSLLWKLDNVFLTPHIAGGQTPNGRLMQGNYIVEEINRFLTEGQLSYDITEERLKIMA